MLASCSQTTSALDASSAPDVRHAPDVAHAPDVSDAPDFPDAPAGSDAGLSCAPDRVRCEVDGGASCFDLRTDPRHCGACGAPCCAGAGVRARSVRAELPAGQHRLRATGRDVPGVRSHRCLPLPLRRVQRRLRRGTGLPGRAVHARRVPARHRAAVPHGTVRRARPHRLRDVGAGDRGGGVPTSPRSACLPPRGASAPTAATTRATPRRAVAASIPPAARTRSAPS